MSIKLFLKELFLFGAVQVIGVWVARSLFNTLPMQVLTKNQFQIRDNLIFLAILVIAILFIRKSPIARAWVYKIFYAVALVAGTQTVFSLIFNNLISIVLAVVLTAAVFKTKLVWIHNLAIVLSLAGIGGVFGLSITPSVAIIILTVLSFYDIIAVYKTKHMVQMAKDMIQSRAIFGIILPKYLRGWSESLNNVQPGDQFMILGSGDIALPLVLTASVSQAGLMPAVVVLLFSVLGLFITHLLFSRQKERRPMAALPPIATLSIIGYLVSLLI